MADLMLKAYQAYDNAIMYVAEKTVKAWNWTTGGTKANLANTTACVTPPAFICLAYSMSPIMGFATGAIVLPAIHIFQKCNLRAERLEARAIERETLDPEVEIIKKRYETGGNFCMGFSLSTLLQAPSAERPELSLSAFLGNLAMGASCSIMRVPYIPPRKSCIRRAAEKLKKSLDGVVESVRSLGKKPVSSPSGT